MSSVKLTADSGGGTVELKAPPSTDGNSNKQIIVNQYGFGKIIQCKMVTSTGNNTTTSGTYQHASAYDTAITPKSSSSTILIHWSGVVRAYDNNGQEGHARIAVTKDDGSTWLCQNYNRCKTWNSDGILNDITVTALFSESAANTSARTYEIWYRMDAGDAVEINPNAGTGNNASTMCVMEVEA